MIIAIFCIKVMTVIFLELGDVSSGSALACSLSTLAEHLGGFVATETSTPVTALLLVLVRTGT
jgi:hypothetical protein